MTILNKIKNHYQTSDTINQNRIDPNTKKKHTQKTTTIKIQTSQRHPQQHKYDETRIKKRRLARDTVPLRIPELEVDERGTEFHDRLHILHAVLP